jgi:hypothetical protein
MFCDVKAILQLAYQKLLSLTTKTLRGIRSTFKMFFSSNNSTVHVEIIKDESDAIPRLGLALTSFK